MGKSLLAWAFVGLILSVAVSVAWLWYERGHGDLSLEDVILLAGVGAGSAVTMAAAALTRWPPLYGALAGSICYFLLYMANQYWTGGFRSTALLGNFGIGLAWGFLLGLIVLVWRQATGSRRDV